MHDDHPHPLLSQVPLAVSPFVSLPTAVPLPYSYKALPSTLPPSILQPQNMSQPPPPNNNANASSHTQTQTSAAYVVSSTGTTATPDQILQSCQALQIHLAKMQDDAQKRLRAWEEERRKEDLAEKRRVAPGWLDSGVHILRPENVEERKSEEEEQRQRQGVTGEERQDGGEGRGNTKEGEELDRVFGGLGLK